MTDYKDSEVGRIPADWEVTSLADIGEVKMCKRVLKDQTTENGEIPFYKISTFGKKADAYIATNLYLNYKEKFSYPKRGDVLLSAAGTIGRTVIFDGAPSYFQDSNIVWVDNDERKVLNLFLYYVYKEIKWVTESGTIPRIYNGTVRSIKFAYPIDKNGQNAIANSLSSIDSLIYLLEELIEKKRMIKEGLMQELLTGKKRLRGFSGEWQSVRMEEIEIKKGAMLKSSEYEPGNVPVIAGGVSAAGYHSKANRPSNTITISGSGANAGFVNFFEEPIFASDCSTINEQKSIYVKYLYYALLLKQPEIYKCQTGGAQPHIHAKDIKDIVIPMPTLKDEQVAVASVLTEIDKQIIAIESQRDKYLHIKQGMMQELLTGKTRL